MEVKGAAISVKVCCDQGDLHGLLGRIFVGEHEGRNGEIGGPIATVDIDAITTTHIGGKTPTGKTIGLGHVRLDKAVDVIGAKHLHLQKDRVGRTGPSRHA
jgi:hypothetical protein